MPTQERPPPRTSNEPDHFDDELDESAPLLVPPPPRTQSAAADDPDLEDLEDHIGSKSLLSSPRRGDLLFGFLAVVRSTRFLLIW